MSPRSRRYKRLTECHSDQSMEHKVGFQALLADNFVTCNSICSTSQGPASETKSEGQQPCSLISVQSTRALSCSTPDIASSSDKSMSSRIGKVVRYQAFQFNTIFGYIHGVTIFREVPNEAEDDDTKPPPMRLVQAVTTASFSPFFLSRVLYWRNISLHGSSVERRWTVYSHDEQSVLWELCAVGDIAGVQQALSNGCSPHILRYDPYDEEQENLLHVRWSTKALPLHG